MLKKFTSILLIFSMTFSLTACGNNSKPSTTGQEADSETVTFTPSDTPKEFSNEYLSITLSDDYKETASEDYTCQFTSNQSICFALHESSDEIKAAGYSFDTIEDYRNATLEKSGISYEETKEYSDSETNDTQNDTDINSCSSTWTKTINDSEYTYKAFFHKTNNSYWTIQFVCHSDLFPILEEHYEKFNNSVVFVK